MANPQELALTDSTPEQAAQNISGAETFGVDPQVYKQFKDDLINDVANEPMSATTTVQKYTSQTPEHSKLFEKDIPAMSSIERTTKWLADSIYNRPVKEDRYTDLQLKKMNDPDNFTDNDELELHSIKLELADHQNLGVASDVVSSISTMGLQVLKNADYINKVTMASAALGYGVGMVTPVPGGALLGAGTTATAGFSAALTTTFAYEAARQQTASTFGTLTDMENDPVNPIKLDPTAKKYISYGVGGTVGLINGVVMHKLGKTLPFVNNFASPKAAVAYVLNPTNAAIKESIMNIGKAIVAGGTGAYYTTVVQVLGEELARVEANPSKASFLNAIANASDRITEATAKGAAVSGAIGAAGAAIGFRQTEKLFAKQQDAAVAGAKDVTTVAPEKRLQTSQPSVEGTSIPVEPPPSGPTFTNDFHGMKVDGAVKILQFEQTIEAMNKAAKGTEAYKLALDQFQALRKEILDDAGLNKLWIDRQDLKKMEETEEGVNAVKKLLGSPLAETNGPVVLDSHKVLNIADQFPKILEDIRLAPDEPSASEARTLIDRIEKANQKRQELFTKLGVSSEARAIDPIDNTQNTFSGTLPLVHASNDANFTHFVDPLTLPDESRYSGGGNQNQLGDAATYFDETGVWAGKGGMDRVSSRKKVVGTKVDFKNAFLLTYENYKKQLPYLRGLLNKEKKPGTLSDISKVLADEGYDGLIVRGMGKVEGSLNSKTEPLWEELHFKLDKKLYDIIDNNPKLSRQEAMNLYHQTPEGKRSLAILDELKKIEKDFASQFAIVGERAVSGKKQNVFLTDIPQDQVVAFKPHEQATIVADLTGSTVGELAPFLLEEGKYIFNEKTKTRELNPEYFPPLYDRAGYEARPLLSEAIKKIMPEADVTKIEEAQKAARAAVADNIAEIQQHEMDKVYEVELQEAREQAEMESLQKLENDPNVQLVERFTKSIFDKKALTVSTHAKKGYSPFAMDPEKVPENLKKYLNSKQLKKHKAFVKGGVSPDESARMLGLRSGEDLLKVLASTRDKETLLEARMNLRQKWIERDARAMVPLENLESIKMYGAREKTTLQELNFLRTHKWPGMKAGIKRIAKKAKSIEEFNIQARGMVAKTKVGELNWRQYKVGEKKSHNGAIDAILKNDIERAVDFKEAEILNIALQKESLIAIGKVNRVFRLAKKIGREDYQKILRNAGELYVDAANEILDVFRLDANKRGISKAKAFQKWLIETKDRNEGIFDIPDHLADVRESAMDLSTEQLLAIGDRLEAILHTAKMKSKLYDKWNTIQKIKYLDAVAADLHDEAFLHPGYEPSRALEKSENQTNWLDERIRFFRDLTSQLDRPQYVILHLDNFKVSGLWNQTLWQPLKISRDKKAAHFEVIKKHIEKEIIKYGKKEFELLSTKEVYIEELAGVKTLGDGRGTINRRDLLEVALHFGSESDIDRAVKSWGVSAETWFDIFEKHIEEKGMDFIQHAIWDTFKSLEKDVLALEKESGNVDVKLIPAKSFVHRGITRRGGFYPAQYVKTTEKTVKNILQGAMETKKQEKFKNTLYAQAMTNQDYLELRTGMPRGSELSIDGSIFGNRIEEVLHDIYFRHTIRDVGLILSHDSVMKDIKAIAGREGLMTLTHFIEDVAKSRQMSDLGAADGIFSRLMKIINKNFGRATISFNPSSHLKQFESILLGLKQMGSTGWKHLYSVLESIIKNPEDIAYFYEFAEEIHPQIRFNRENVDIHAGNSITELLHKEKKVHMKVRNLGHTVDLGFHKPIKIGDQKIDLMMPVNMSITLAEAAGDLGLSYFEHFDTFNKTMIALSAYRQFLNGDAPNYPLDVLRKLSPEELEQKARTYASEVVELTQTSTTMMNLSGAQKAETFKWAFLFYNDRNNTYNNLKMSGLQIKYKVKEAGQKIREGDSSEGVKSGLGAVGTLGSTLLFLSMARYLTSLIDSMRDGNQDEIPLTQDKPVDEHFKDLAAFYLKGSVSHAFGVVPLASEMQYAIESYSKTKSVKFPFNSVLDNTAASIQGILMMLDLMEGDPESKTKNMVYATGYLTGAPTPAAYKALKALGEMELPPVLEKGEWDMLYERISNFLEVNRGNENIDPGLMQDLERLKKELETSKPGDQEIPPTEKSDEEFLRDLEKLKLELDNQNLTPEEQEKESALQVIRDLEGLRLKAYKDTGGVWTIGYGTTKGVKEGDTITKEEAEKKLVEYYDEMKKHVDKMINPARELTPGQRIALYSFAYNVGDGNFQDSTLLKKLNDPDKYSIEEVAREFKKWIYDDGVEIEGLKTRRAKEEALFLAEDKKVDKKLEIPKG